MKRFYEYSEEPFRDFGAFQVFEPFAGNEKVLIDEYSVQEQTLICYPICQGSIIGAGACVYDAIPENFWKWTERSRKSLLKKFFDDRDY